MTRYAVVDAEGRIANMIEWDGETPYNPGEGCTMRPATLDDDIDPAAPLPEAIPVVPAVEPDLADHTAPLDDEVADQATDGEA